MTKEEYFKFFEATTKQMLEVCRKKNADYTGKDASPFSNFERVETLGICTTEQGFLTRITDKLCRVSSFCAKGELQVKDESVTDTLQDMANYCILMMGYLRSKQPETDPAGAVQLPLPLTYHNPGTEGVWVDITTSSRSKATDTIDQKLITKLDQLPHLSTEKCPCGMPRVKSISINGGLTTVSPRL